MTLTLARHEYRPVRPLSQSAYFLSEDTGFTTGQVLYVCGGLSVGLAPI
jgi:hypothetical protein